MLFSDVGAQFVAKAPVKQFLTLPEIIRYIAASHTSVYVLDTLLICKKESRFLPPKCSCVFARAAYFAGVVTTYANTPYKQMYVTYSRLVCQHSRKHHRRDPFFENPGPTQNQSLRYTLLLGIHKRQSRCRQSNNTQIAICGIAWRGVTVKIPKPPDCRTFGPPQRDLDHPQCRAGKIPGFVSGSRL